MSHYRPGFFCPTDLPRRSTVVFPADWEVEEFGGGNVKTQEAHNAGSFASIHVVSRPVPYFSTNALMHGRR